ncbi:MAG: efflux RND transporter permease subunit, partial [Pseudomonadota bacterium]|nr:efflux RND transporter permease subunit [Pseudomonadota bacterium]
VLIQVNPNGAALGFTNQIVGQQLRNAYEGAIARRFARGDNEVTIRVMLPRDFGKPQSLDNFFLAVPGSSPISYVPFAQVVDVSEQPGFASIQRAGGAREVVIRAGFADNSGNPADIIREYSKYKLPSILEKYNVQQVVRGEQEDMKQSFQQLFVGLLIGLGLIYTILALVFSSYSKPLVIMSVIPFGMIGALVGHFIQGYEFNFLSMIALLGLSGILVNNSIILISRIDERHAMGEEFEESIINGVNDRLRAVVLTSLTTVLGLAPMLFETSTQAQFLLPMVITMAWGLASSAFLVLLLVPAILGIQSDIRDYLQQRKQLRTLAE